MKIVGDSEKTDCPKGLIKALSEVSKEADISEIETQWATFSRGIWEEKYACTDEIAL